MLNKHYLHAPIDHHLSFVGKLLPLFILERGDYSSATEFTKRDNLVAMQTWFHIVFEPGLEIFSL